MDLILLQQARKPKKLCPFRGPKATLQQGGAYVGKTLLFYTS